MGGEVAEVEEGDLAFVPYKGEALEGLDFGGISCWRGHAG